MDDETKAKIAARRFPWLDALAAVLTTVWPAPWIAMVTVLSPFDGPRAVQIGVAFSALWIALMVFFIVLGGRRSRWVTWTIPSGLLSVACSALGVALAVYYRS